MLRFGLVCLVATLMGTSLGCAENLECSCLCSNGVDALCIIDRGDQELGSVLETTTNYGLVALGKHLFLFSQCANPSDALPYNALVQGLRKYNGQDGLRGFRVRGERRCWLRLGDRR